MTRRKVFGIGFNKTGTSTLGSCLRRLGYRHVSHSSAMLAAYEAGDFDRMIAETRRYDSFEDWPWPLIFRQFYAEYGDEACYVLTVRASSQVWLDSLKKHALTTHPDRPMRSAVFGHKYPHGREQEHIRLYEEHNRTVRAYFAARPKASFIELCWERGHGWAELCGFLGHPVPDAPFPHVRPNQNGIDPRIIAANRTNIEAQLAAIAEPRPAAVATGA
jgi:hypothetical protein